MSASARLSKGRRPAPTWLRLLACAGLAGGTAAACDPTVSSHPLDKGPAPGIVGTSGALGEEGWKAATAPSMPGMGPMTGGMGTGAPPGAVLPPAVTTGDGAGLPADGPSLFALLCEKCHGPVGKGDGTMGPMLKVADLTAPDLQARLTDDAIARMIVHGRNKMPAFGGAITAAQLDALVKHVRSLKR